MKRLSQLMSIKDGFSCRRDVIGNYTYVLYTWKWNKWTDIMYVCK